MRNDPTQPKPASSWWTTLPGFITAIAALTTAIGGFILVMHQTGRLSTGPNPATTSTVLQRTEAKTLEPTAVAVAASTAPAPVAAMQAVIIRKNGEQFEVRSSSLQKIMVGETLTFQNGQSIAIDRVSKLEVIEFDSSTYEVSVVLTLVSGKTYAGSLDASSGAHGFQGSNELGKVEVALSDIKSVDFGR